MEIIELPGEEIGVYVPLIVGLAPGLVYWCVITAMRKRK